MQKALERDARGGTRYTEMLLAHYGVHNPDARLQRPEFLGGEHIPLTQTQVAQTSGSNTTGQTTPQGNLSAFSLTTDNSNLITKSFTEHGYLIILASVRTEHTYQNNLDKFWSRSKRFDFHHPVFNNIGEQPVHKGEIKYNYGQHTAIFGYQEA